MQQLDSDEVRIHIKARPEHIYDVVSDVTRTPEFSPEILRCTWLDGATGPAIGASFEVVNRAGRGPAWKNGPVILAADRGREFAFARTEKLAGTLLWRYGFEIDGDGTLVTESYEVTEPISRAGWFIIGTVCGNHDRRADLRAGMEQTLQRLRDVAESPATA